MLTSQQIIQLAPDTSAAKAGTQLAVASKWVRRAVHEKAIWGDCQGSGKEPYQTIIDLSNIAFKCSCPSRKFPCKHGLGLFLLYVDQPNTFSVETDLPEYVNAWLEKRNEKIEKSEKIEHESTKNNPDTGQQKRASAREKKVSGGIAELRAWLNDVARTGIVKVPQSPSQFTRNITARMVDAQAGGLANQLRKINKINFYKEGWQQLLVAQLSKIFLLTESYLHLERLAPAMQRDILAMIGWNIPKEEVLAGESVSNHWAILSKTFEEDSNLLTERIWLYGTETKRFALLLNYYAGDQLPPNTLVEGTTIAASLVYYPSIYPMRALIKEQVSTHTVCPPILGSGDMVTVFETVAAVVSYFPVVEKIPILIQHVRIALQGGQWYLMDQDQQGIALDNTVEICWKILSTTGGRSFACFAIYEYEMLHIQAIWVDEKYYFML